MSGNLDWDDWWRTVSAKANLEEETAYSNAHIPTSGIKDHGKSGEHDTTKGN